MAAIPTTQPKSKKQWWEEEPQGPDPFAWQKLSNVQRVDIEWLWKPYIPRGAVTLIAGDGGYGKSWMTCALAASLSKGEALPGQAPLPPQRVLMISAEDGLGEVVRPKMDVLGANMDNITCSDRAFEFNPSTRQHLARVIEQNDVAVVFLDPLVVYLGGKMDMFRANETRDKMGMLVDVAKHTRCAIVAVHHVRKSGEGSVQNKVMGSADFVNGVRSALLVDKSKGGQRYMAHAKSNWAANGDSLAYKFGPQGFQWQGPYEGTHDSQPEVSTTKRGMVQNWLREQLSGGPVPASVMMENARKIGLPEITVQRGKANLVNSIHKDGRWMWELFPQEMERMQREAAAMVATAPSPETIERLSKEDPSVREAQEAARRWLEKKKTSGK